MSYVTLSDVVELESTVKGCEDAASVLQPSALGITASPSSRLGSTLDLEQEGVGKGPFEGELNALLTSGADDERYYKIANSSRDA